MRLLLHRVGERPTIKAKLYESESIAPLTFIKRGRGLRETLEIRLQSSQQVDLWLVAVHVARDELVLTEYIDGVARTTKGWRCDDIHNVFSVPSLDFAYSAIKLSRLT